MERVWVEIARRDAKRARQYSKDPLASLPDDLRLKVRDCKRYASVADELCAAFFFAALLEFCFPRDAIKADSFKREAQRWRDGAFLFRGGLGGELGSPN